MRRTLSLALPARPLLFEPAPPSARGSPKRAAEHLEEVKELLLAVPRVDAVDVPELIDENHDGRPLYRSRDIREFARTLEEATGCEAIVNKVVAHLPSKEGLADWARETVGRGIRHAVLVGGSSRYIPYPGPLVVEANRICRPVFEGASGLVGNVAIPQRAGEAHRLLSKTRAGARFFTTQILFDSVSLLAMVREYDLLCRQSGVPPATVILSLAPVVDEGDAEFVRWLGADIPEEAERSILGGDDGEAAARSVRHSLGLWAEVRSTLGSAGIEVPVGVIVEEIMPRHLGPAADILRALAREIDRPAK